MKNAWEIKCPHCEFEYIESDEYSLYVDKLQCRKCSEWFTYYREVVYVTKKLTQPQQAQNETTSNS